MSNVRKLSTISMLLGIAIVLNIIEMQISFIPVPGAKIGFANLVSLIVLYIYGFKDALITNILRVVMVALLSPKGFDFTFIMAISGAISSIIVMAFLKNVIKLHIITVSVIGALIHNLAQVIVLIFFLQTPYLVLYYPIMLVIGIPAGIIIGIMAMKFLDIFNVHKFSNPNSQPVLVIPSIKHKSEALKFFKELMKDSSGKSKIELGISSSYEEWLEDIKDDGQKKVIERNYVPSRLYFLIKENHVVGMIDCRLSINDSLKVYGGHIGYSIRPKYRRCGYGYLQLKLALELYKAWNYTEVLLTCNKTNIASQKTIIKNGGVLEKEGIVNGRDTLYYTIKLS